MCRYLINVLLLYHQIFHSGIQPKVGDDIVPVFLLYKVGKHCLKILW